MKHIEKIEKIVVEEKVKYITCDVCGKEIQDTYWKLNTHHYEWGNDSGDSYENYDICSHQCACIKLEEYFNQCRDHTSLCFELEESCFNVPSNNQMDSPDIFEEFAKNHGFKNYDDIVNCMKYIASITSQKPRCKECKWWKDSDGVFRRGCGAESKCLINTNTVYQGEGYCYMFSPKAKSEGLEDETDD